MATNGTTVSIDLDVKGPDGNFADSHTRYHNLGPVALAGMNGLAASLEAEVERVLALDPSGAGDYQMKLEIKGTSPEVRIQDRNVTYATMVKVERALTTAMATLVSYAESRVASGEKR